MDSILAALDYLDLVPGGRLQVGDENVGPWLGASAHRAPLLISPFPLFGNNSCAPIPGQNLIIITSAPR